jgi:hypothetical protein
MKQMAFELAIKMVLLIHFQSKKEMSVGSGCVILFADTLN